MKAPWHLWFVGIVSFLWNALGAMDYFMTQTRNEAYMSSFSPEQLEFFYGFPAWVDASWAVAVWGAVLGSVLLLFRAALALWAFIVSFLGMMLTTIHNVFLADRSVLQTMGGFELAFTGLIVAVGLFLIWYARRMKIAGVLR